MVRSLPVIYFHRFYRIIPTLGLFICLFLTFYVFLGTGPIWESVSDGVNGCKEYWWTVMLFINNFYPPATVFNCMNVLWYLANDMLFFMFVPIVVFLYVNKKLLGYISVLWLILVCIIVTFSISQHFKHPMTMIKDSNVRRIYHQPWTRFGAYFVGSLFGMMYFEWTKARNNPAYRNMIGTKFYDIIYNHRIIRLFLYLISSAIMLFLIFIPQTETHTMTKVVWPQIASSFFNAFHRIVFVTALALFLSGAMVGRSPFVRFVLGGSAWAPWAKITFIAYLVHPLVIAWYYFQINQGMFVTKRMAFYWWFASFMLSYLLSIPVALLIESPFLQIEKLVLFPPKERSEKVNVKGEFRKLQPSYRKINDTMSAESQNSLLMTQ